MHKDNTIEQDSQDTPDELEIKAFLVEAAKAIKVQLINSNDYTTAAKVDELIECIKSQIRRIH